MLEPRCRVCYRWLCASAAIDAARNCRRRYRVEAGQDPFGAWLVTITFGRLGALGRTIVHVVDDEHQARRRVVAWLPPVLVTPDVPEPHADERDDGSFDEEQDMAEPLAIAAE